MAKKAPSKTQEEAPQKPKAIRKKAPAKKPLPFDAEPAIPVKKEAKAIMQGPPLIPKEGFVVPPPPSPPEGQRWEDKVRYGIEGRIPAFINDPEVKVTILAAIGMGLDLSTAAQAAGLCGRTLQAWIYRGRDFLAEQEAAKREGRWKAYVNNRSDEELERENAYIVLLHEIKTTHAKFGLRNARTIQDAAEGIQRDLDGKIVRGKTQDAKGNVLPTLRKKPSWQAAAYLLERRRSKIFGKPFFDASPQASSSLPAGHVSPQAIVNAVAEVLEELFAPVVSADLYANAVQQIQERLSALSQEAAKSSKEAAASQLDAEIQELAPAPDPSNATLKEGS